MGALLGGNSAPTPPPIPTPPPAASPATVASAQVQSVGASQRQKAALASGMGGDGTQTMASTQAAPTTAKTQLLGG